jgi:hypothetical protein
MTLEEMELASETGQMVVVRATVSVTVITDWALVGRVAMSVGLAGQLVTVAAHEVMVRMVVVTTVRVVRLAGSVGATTVGSTVLLGSASTLLVTGAVPVGPATPEPEAPAETPAEVMGLVEFWRRKLKC